MTDSFNYNLICKKYVKLHLFIFPTKKNQVHSTFCWEMAAKTKLFIFFVRCALAARRVNIFWMVGHVAKPTNHVPLVAAIRAGSRDNNNILFFSKSGLVFAKIDKIECGLLEIVQRWLPLRMCGYRSCADFFLIKFLWQIPLKNDILLILNVFC